MTITKSATTPSKMAIRSATGSQRRYCILLDSLACVPQPALGQPAALVVARLGGMWPRHSQISLVTLALMRGLIQSPIGMTFVAIGLICAAVGLASNIA